MNELPAYIYPIIFFVTIFSVWAALAYFNTRDTNTRDKPQTPYHRGPSHRSDEEHLLDDAKRYGFSTVEGYEDWRDKQAKLARKQSWQASQFGKHAEQAKNASTFRQHKLECTNCGSPLSLLGGKLAGCEFCKSQYYLEGFEEDVLPQVPFGDSRSLDSAYSIGGGIGWVDGGVSIRAAQPHEYAVWK